MINFKAYGHQLFFLLKKKITVLLCLPRHDPQKIFSEYFNLGQQRHRVKQMAYRIGVTDMCKHMRNSVQNLLVELLPVASLPCFKKTLQSCKSCSYHLASNCILQYSTEIVLMSEYLMFLLFHIDLRNLICRFKDRKNNPALMIMSKIIQPQL